MGTTIAKKRSETISLEVQKSAINRENSPKMIPGAQIIGLEKSYGLPINPQGDLGLLKNFLLDSLFINWEKGYSPSSLKFG